MNLAFEEKFKRPLNNFEFMKGCHEKDAEQLFLKKGKLFKRDLG